MFAYPCEREQLQDHGGESGPIAEGLEWLCRVASPIPAYVVSGSFGVLVHAAVAGGPAAMWSLAAARWPVSPQGGYSE
ncbi:hypothetical protein GCM10009780_03630 [Actinomadura alba]